MLTEGAVVLDGGGRGFEGVGSHPSIDGRTTRSGLLQVTCGTGIQTQPSGAFASTRIDEKTYAVRAVAAEFLKVAYPGLDLMVETFASPRDPLWLNAGFAARWFRSASP